jgi:excisionase family DNA binding protein
MSRKKESPTGEYLSPLQFAETLDLCQETIYRLIARGELAAVRVGRRLRLPRNQLDSLLIGNDRRVEGL